MANTLDLDRLIEVFKTKEEAVGDCLCIDEEKQIYQAHEDTEEFQLVEISPEDEYYDQGFRFAALCTDADVDDEIYTEEDFDDAEEYEE